MIADLLLTTLRLLTCFMLAQRIRSAWLLGICSSVYKISILSAIDCKILASSKCLTLLLSGYAWFKWGNKDHVATEHPDHKIGSAHLLIAGICLLSVVATHTLVRAVDLQTIIGAVNLLAYYMAAHKHRSCWTVWIVYDILLICLFVEKKLYLNAVTTILYIPIALSGHHFWTINHKKSKKDNTKEAIVGIN